MMMATSSLIIGASYVFFLERLLVAVLFFVLFLLPFGLPILPHLKIAKYNYYIIDHLKNKIHLLKTYVLIW